MGHRMPGWQLVEMPEPDHAEPDLPHLACRYPRLSQGQLTMERRGVILGMDDEQIDPVGL